MPPDAHEALIIGLHDSQALPLVIGELAIIDVSVWNPLQAQSMLDTFIEVFRLPSSQINFGVVVS